MKISRIGALAAGLVACVLTLSGCVVQASEVVEGSGLSVAWNEPFTSYNPYTSYGNASSNASIAAATNSSFNSYDSVPQLVQDTSYGTYELITEDPLVVKYTVADGIKWSDGTPVDAIDLLLQWAALSGALDTKDFDAHEFVDPDTGEFTDAFPDDVVYFDSGSDPDFGLGLVRDTPELSEDMKSLTLTYSAPFVDWDLQMTSPLPAHVVGEQALGLDSADVAKAAIAAAIVGNDRSALAKISSFWNSGFNVSTATDYSDVMVGSGPYTITDVVAGQYVTLTANPNYVGDHRPKIEQITVRFIADPLAAIQALQNGAVQVIAPEATTTVANALSTVDVTVIGGVGSTAERIVLQTAQGRSGALDNPLIRQAFLKVIPRQQIVDELVVPISPEAEVRNSQVFMPGAIGYSHSVASNGSADFAEVDIPGAIALLAQAGVPNPEVCVLYSPTSPRRVKEFSLIQATAAQAGFAVTDCSSPTWRDELGLPGVYDAAIYGLDTTSLAVTAGAPPSFATEGLNNTNFYSSPAMDALTSRLATTLDRDDQSEILTSIDAQAWSDFVGMPLFQFPTLTAYDQTAVDGVDPSPLAPTLFWNIWDWSPVGATAP